MESVKIGDIFFTKSHSILSKGIRFFSHGRFSHCMVIVHIDPLSVVSADAEGVICRDVRQDEFEHYKILTCNSLTEDQRKNICQWCFSKIGTGYDFLALGGFLINADIQDEDRFFCSELVHISYLEAGVPLVKRIDHSMVSPEILYISPLLEVVEEPLLEPCS